jgi:hypothetical protein
VIGALLIIPTERNARVVAVIELGKVPGRPVRLCGTAAPSRALQ